MWGNLINCQYKLRLDYIVKVIHYTCFQHYCEGNYVHPLYYLLCRGPLDVPCPIPYMGSKAGNTHARTSVGSFTGTSVQPDCIKKAATSPNVETGGFCYIYIFLLSVDHLTCI